MSVIPSTGPEPSTWCEQSPIGASHPVQALMESFTVLSGCASRGTTGLPQEVHILNLRIADQGAAQPQREVSVGVAVYVRDRTSENTSEIESSLPSWFWGSELTSSAL